MAPSFDGSDINEMDGHQEVDRNNLQVLQSVNQLFGFDKLRQPSCPHREPWHKSCLIEVFIACGVGSHWVIDALASSKHTVMGLSSYRQASISNILEQGKAPIQSVSSCDS